MSDNGFEVWHKDVSGTEPATNLEDEREILEEKLPNDYNAQEVYTELSTEELLKARQEAKRKSLQQDDLTLYDDLFVEYVIEIYTRRTNN